MRIINFLLIIIEITSPSTEIWHYLSFNGYTPNRWPDGQPAHIMPVIVYCFLWQRHNQELWKKTTGNQEPMLEQPWRNENSFDTCWEAMTTALPSSWRWHPGIPERKIWIKNCRWQASGTGRRRWHHKKELDGDKWFMAYAPQNNKIKQVELLNEVCEPLAGSWSGIWARQGRHTAASGYTIQSSAQATGASPTLNSLLSPSRPVQCDCTFHPTEHIQMVSVTAWKRPQNHRPVA